MGKTKIKKFRIRSGSVYSNASAANDRRHFFIERDADGNEWLVINEDPETAAAMDEAVEIYGDALKRLAKK